MESPDMKQGRMTVVEQKEASPAVAEAVCRLLAQLTSRPCPFGMPELEQMLRSGNCRLFMARVDNEAVGMLTVGQYATPTGRKCWLEDVVVDEHFRGRSIGRALVEAAIAAGSKDKDTYLIEEPMAASIGAGLPVAEPTGSMVVDIGGGTSEVAVISLGGIVTSTSLRVAGDALDNAIVGYIKREFNLAIGDRTAEEIKITIGSAYPLEQEEKMEIRGRDLLSGLPKTIEVNSVHVREALSEPVSSIIETIKQTLEATPPELAADVMEYGITLTGGGALLRGLDELITSETGMPVHVANEPLNCVAMGTGLVLEHIDTLKNVLISPRKALF